MRLREFRQAVSAEFGERAPSITADLVLGGFGVSADAALAAGADPGAVWEELCRMTDVPPQRRHGAGLREPRG